MPRLVSSGMSAPVATLQRMAVPEVIPILYVPDHHTGTVGHWEGGHGLVIETFEGVENLLVRDRTVTNSGS